jgi:hypothetical protein
VQRSSRVVLGILILAALAIPLRAADEWNPLFNGKDLSGWKHVGPGTFLVENGMMKTLGGMGLLWYSGEKLGNCVIRVVYKTSSRTDNSGVFIRIDGEPWDEWYAVHHGYEVQILEEPPAGMPTDPWHTTGALYSLSQAKTGVAKPAGEWNTMEITLDGPTTIVMLNGVKVNEFKEGQKVPPRKRWYEPERGPRPDVGYFGLQNHDLESTVYFKEVSVKPLGK